MLPENWSLVPIQGRYVLRDGTPATGYITFESRQVVMVDGVQVVPKTLVAHLTKDGEIPAGFALPSTDDPALSVGGWAYKVTESWQGGRNPFSIFVPHNAALIDLPDAAPVVPPPELADTRGPRGYAGTMAVESVETVEAGIPASVENVGDASDARLVFRIPKGDTGDVTPEALAARDAAVGAASAAAQSAVDAAAAFPGLDARVTDLEENPAFPDAPDDGGAYIRVNGAWVQLYAPLALAGDLPDGTVGEPYTATLEAAGGLPPYTLGDVLLPPGLGATLSDATVTVAGTPSEAWEGEAHIDLSDALGTAIRRVLETRVGLAPFAPHDLASLVAWHDPSDLTTMFQDVAGAVPVTASGQTVRRINDKSGTSLHITNATGWVLAENALGGRYLVANGTSAFTGAIAGWSGTALTLACAFNTLSTPTGNEFLVSLGHTANASDYGGLRLINTEGRAEFMASGALGTMSAFAESQGVPSDPHVQIALTSGPTVHRDLTTNAGTGGIANLAAINVYSIGALTRSITNSYASGHYYGSVAVARSIAAAEVLGLNGYLRSKFGAAGHFVAIGDSHTFNNTLGVTEAQFYPRRLAAALGGDKIALNYGLSGNTTANMVSRIPNTTEAGRPDFAIIYGSTNDNSGQTTVQASPPPTASAFTVAATIGNRYGAGALITVNGADAEVFSVAGDRITLTQPLGVTPIAGQAVAIRTKDNLVKIGRAYQALGCDRILVPGLHYYNFASGLGDTTSTQNAGAATLRAAQQAAAAELGAVYVDLYAWMRGLIVAGDYAQGNDTAWHVAVSDAHLNAAGEQILADAMYAAMQNQGWA